LDVFSKICPTTPINTKGIFLKTKTHREQLDLASKYLFDHAVILQSEAEKLEILGIPSAHIYDEIVKIRDLADVLKLGISTEK